MKISKTFSIDLDVYDALKHEANMSLIINNFLRQYFDLDRAKSKRDEQTDKIIDEVIDAKLE